MIHMIIYGVWCEVAALMSCNGAAAEAAGSPGWFRRATADAAVMRNRDG